ncbi:MAG: penicillin-binding protein 2 [Steroidobacteraceae bacterium]
MFSKGRIKDHWTEQRMFEQRAIVAGVLIAVLTGGLILRLAWLQIWRHDYFTELSQGNRVRIEPLPAPRGIIYDRNGTILAENRPAYQLELVREEVPDLEQTLDGLVAIGLIPKEDREDVRRLVRSRRPFDSVPIRLRLTDEEIARFAVRRFEFPGVDIKTRLARFYPFGEMAVHALGHVGAISEADMAHIDRAEYAGTATIGKLGIESAYEKQLHGANGSREILVNARGRSVDKQGALRPDLRTVASKPGTDLVLAMDFEVQRVAEEALWQQRGAVVAIDPANGDLIALVSRPGFDPNLFARGLTRAEFSALNTSIDRPLFNRALRGVYPPGSTVKPAMALAGLAYKVVNPVESRFCRGVFTLPGSRHQYREGKGGRHGNVDLIDSIARSCDVYYYALASTLGVDRIVEFLHPFGFGEPTGIDIGGEKPGLLPSPAWKRKAFANPAEQVWFPGETVIFGIGQGYLLVTPLQLAHYAAALATQGKVYRPRLVTATREPLSGRLEKVEPVRMPDVQLATPEQWAIVLQGMIGTTKRGTAAAIGRDAQYDIAGKTGTAQVFSVAQNERYDAKTVQERLRDHAWFIAFAPAEAPRIAVAVLVENGGFGASAAAPIARKVMDAYLLRKFPPRPGDAAGGASTTAPAAAAPAAPAAPTAPAAPVPAPPTARTAT